MPRRRRLSGLGQDANGDAAITQICPGGAAAAPCGCTVDTANVTTLFEQSASSRYLMWPPPDPSWAVCSGITETGGQQVSAGLTAGAKVGGTAAGALTAASVGGAAVPIIGAAIVGVAAIVSIFTSHHAAAVQAQSNALCSAVPAMNDALTELDAEISAGTISATDAASAVQQLASQFTSLMKQGTSYKQCDALYAYNLAMQMVAAARLADLQSGAAGPVGGTISIGGASLPGWAVIAGAAAIAYFLL